MNNNDVNNFETVNKVDNMNTLDNLNNISDVNNMNIGPVVGVEKAISKKYVWIMIIFGVVAAGIIGYVILGKVIFSGEVKGGASNSGSSMIVDENEEKEKEEIENPDDEEIELDEDDYNNYIDLEEEDKEDESITQDNVNNQNGYVNQNTESNQNNSMNQNVVNHENIEYDSGAKFDDLVKLLKDYYKSRGKDIYDEANVASWDIKNINYLGYRSNKKHIKYFVATGSFSCKDGGISCIYMEQVDDTKIDNFKAVFTASKNNGVYKFEYMDSLISEFYLQQEPDFVVVNTPVSK